MNTLAIDIGGTKFTMALFVSSVSALVKPTDLLAGALPKIVRRHRQATDRAGGREWLLSELTQLIRDWNQELHPGRIDRVGIGFGGPVDFPNQRVALSTHVGGWENFPLRDWAAEVAGVTEADVVIDNDANAGTLGEGLFGAGVTDHAGADQVSGICPRPLFYMTLSTGIGGGLMLEDGSIYRGADSWACEIGHITLDPKGPECLCGSRGCFERMCAGLWLERDHGRSAQELLEDEAFTARYTAQVARGLKPAIMLLNPARVVVGGGISKSGDRFFRLLNAELRREMTSWSGARVDVVPAALGDDSVLWGAYGLANRSTV